jgi:quinol monooxygenase YgiN
MIVEYIRYTIPAEQHAAFVRAYEQAREPLDASPNCLGYELARCVDEPDVYVLRIEWDSAEGHLRGFRGSPGFRAFFAAVGPYVGNIVEMRHYELTDVVSAGRGSSQRAPRAIPGSVDSASDWG